MHRIHYEDNLLKGETINDDTFYILFPCSIGDTWYAASFISSYLSYKKINRKICYVVKHSHEGIIRWFISADEAVIISDELVEELNSFSVANGIWQLDNYLYTHFKKNPDLSLFREYYDNSGCMIDKYRQLVFNLPAKAHMATPLFAEPAKELSARYKIDKKTIILMPYAKSTYPLPTVFWESLVRLLAKHGYRILTNTGPGESPIEGTEAIAESVSDTVLLCRKALAVISLRSGICDILAATDVIMFVIYTNNHYYDYWNLSSVRNDGSIANFLCLNDNMIKDTAKSIAECFVDNEYTLPDTKSSNTPLISVIMPVRNNERYFPIAVQTILDQSFTDWELIIMEGLSTDRTAEIADEIASSDQRIRVEHTSEWIYEKVNAGIRLAHGKYFTVVNSDDKLAPDALSIISDYLIKYDVDMFMIAAGSVVCDKDQHELSNDFADIESIIPNEMIIQSSDEMKNNWIRILSSGLLNNQINVYKIDRIKNLRFRNDVYGADYLYNLDVLPHIRSAAYFPKCLYYFHVYRDVSGFNTSVGKFYDYAHNMFNDFYFKGLNMFASSDCLDKDALYYLKKRRYMEFMSSELPMYKFKACHWSLDDILLHIFTDTADIKNLVGTYDFMSDIDDRVLSVCKEVIDLRPDEAASSGSPLVSGINELFRIGRVDLSDVNIELLKQMVYDYHNPSNIGQQLLDVLF